MLFNVPLNVGLDGLAVDCLTRKRFHGFRDLCQTRHDTSPCPPGHTLATSPPRRSCRQSFPCLCLAKSSVATGCGSIDSRPRTPPLPRKTSTQRVEPAVFPKVWRSFQVQSSGRFPIQILGCRMITRMLSPIIRTGL